MDTDLQLLTKILSWTVFALIGCMFIMYTSGHDPDEDWIQRRSQELRKRWRDAIKKAHEEKP